MIKDLKQKTGFFGVLASLFLLFIVLHFGVTSTGYLISMSQSASGENSDNSKARNERPQLAENVLSIEDDIDLPEPPQILAEVENDPETAPVPVVKATPTPAPTPVPAPAPAPVPPPPLTGSCPVSTLSCVPCTAGEQYCRTKMGETSGYLGWACQNNNPGNILAPTASVKAFKDGIIVNNGGTASCGTVLGSNNYTYMVFSTYDIGINSLKAYIKGINNGEHYSYVNAQTSCAGPETYTCGNCTLQQFFCKFAGTSTYATSVANKMGGTVTTSTLLSWVVDNRLDDMVNAIKQTEGFFTQ